MAEPVLYTAAQRRIQNRIDEQAAVVATLEPGTSGHELATRILLLLHDAMFVQREIDMLTAEAARRDGKTDG